VEFTTFGYKTIWAIECKYWNTNVTKEKMLVLQQIIDDIGADKGVLISKKGFQSGAIRAVKKTNIILTNYEDLWSYINEEINLGALDNLSRRIAKLQTVIFDSKRQRNYTDIGELAILEFKVKDAISGKWPITVPADIEEEIFEKVNDPAMLYQYIDKILIGIESKYKVV
ncbi:unnamed protein product, partial [marine sediment metagenome]